MPKTLMHNKLLTQCFLSALLSAWSWTEAAAQGIVQSQTQMHGQGRAPAVMSDYEAGQRYFNAHRYQEASAFFQRGAQTTPLNPTIHYCLANCFVKLGAHERAVQEYRVCYMLDPKGSSAAFCLQALNGYKSKVPDAGEIAAFQKKMLDTAGGAIAEYVNGFSAAKGPPTAVDQADSFVRRQIAQEKVKLAAKCEEQKKNADRLTAAKIRKLEQDAEDEILRLSDPQVTWGYVMGRLSQIVIPPDPALVQRRTEEIRTRVKADKEAAVLEGEEKKKLYEKDLLASEAAINESANNMSNQLSSKGGVKLHAHGSNLYVRQYAPFAGSAALNARPAVGRIVRARPIDSDTGAPTGDGNHKGAR